MYLPWRVLIYTFLNVPSNLDKCLLCELSYKNKKCFIATLYSSPSQSRKDFEKVFSNFAVVIKAISNQKDPISILIGNFNAQSSNWCKYDISNNEGVQIYYTTSTLHSIEQLICEPTHLISNSSSCTDVVFANHPKLVAASGTHPSLQSNCHLKLFSARLLIRLFIMKWICVMVSY